MKANLILLLAMVATLTTAFRMRNVSGSGAHQCVVSPFTANAHGDPAVDSSKVPNEALNERIMFTNSVISTCEAQTEESGTVQTNLGVLTKMGPDAFSFSYKSTPASASAEWEIQGTGHLESGTYTPYSAEGTKQAPIEFSTAPAGTAGPAAPASHGGPNCEEKIAAPQPSTDERLNKFIAFYNSSPKASEGPRCAARNTDGSITAHWDPTQKMGDYNDASKGEFFAIHNFVVMA